MLMMMMRKWILSSKVLVLKYFLILGCGFFWPSDTINSTLVLLLIIIKLRKASHNVAHPSKQTPSKPMAARPGVAALAAMRVSINARPRRFELNQWRAFTWPTIALNRTPSDATGNDTCPWLKHLRRPLFLALQEGNLYLTNQAVGGSSPRLLLDYCTSTFGGENSHQQ